VYSFSRSNLCSVQSKAFDKFKRMVSLYSLLSRFSITSSIIEAIALFVDICFLKPNWELLKMLYLLINDTNCGAVIFSKTFAGTKVIGQ
jgi:hypothetical protein